MVFQSFAIFAVAQQNIKLCRIDMLVYRVMTILMGHDTRCILLQNCQYFVILAFQLKRMPHLADDGICQQRT